jgi:microsomal dipeptidase-like Zn-dependent dipeptidase
MSATYTLTPAGDITFQTVSRGVVTQTITVDSDDNLGLFFDTEDGVLHKHGPAQAVSDYARQIRATYADAGYQDIADGLVFVQIPVAALKDPSVLEEVNKALEITGYVKGFEQKLLAAAGQLA